MPIYEYICSNCNHKFELIQKVSDTSVTSCPNCAASPAQRLVSAPGFQLKGTGWYVTDFKDKKPKETKTAESALKTADGSGHKKESKETSVPKTVVSEQGST